MGRIGTPQNRRSRDTRAAVLDATWQLLERSGGSAPTMAAVADAAGISRQGLYLHFASRGQLFMALMDHVDETLDLETSLRPITEAPDAFSALDAFAEHVARYHALLIGVARAVERARHDDEDAAALWERSTGAWYSGSRSIAERLDREGFLAQPWTATTAADLMWALMSVELVDGLTATRGWSIDELAARLAVVLRRTLCGTGG